MLDLSKNVMTFLVIAYAGIGGVLVILTAVGVVDDPAARLSFNQYLQSMAIAVAGTAVGRGIAARSAP